MIKPLSLVMAVLFFSMPFLTSTLATAQIIVIPGPGRQPLLPQNEVQGEAQLQAKIDASWQKQRIWCFYGFGSMGLSVIPAIIPARIPVERFIGKSPQYILHYTHVYREKVAIQRVAYSFLGQVGCLGGIVGVSILFGL